MVNQNDNDIVDTNWGRSGCIKIESEENQTSDEQILQDTDEEVIYDGSGGGYLPNVTVTDNETINETINELINQTTDTPEPEEKKGSMWWFWIVIILGVIGVIAFIWVIIWG